MKLPVPIGEYTEIEFKKPKAKVLTRTTDALEKRGGYPAILEYIAGCTAILTKADGEEIEEPNDIKRIIKNMPYANTFFCIFEIAKTLNKETKVEGIYYCPRCNQKIISEETPDLDSRDDVNLCEVNYYEGEPVTNGQLDFDLILEEPFEIKNKKTGEVIGGAKKLTFEMVTLDHCIKGMINKKSDNYRTLMFAIAKADDEILSGADRGNWGMRMIENLSVDELKVINAHCNKYGLQAKVHKECPECGKEFESELDIKSFFASGLK